MIRLARVVTVLGRADAGLFNCNRVMLAFHGLNYEVPAYAKKLSDLDMLVEIMVALIGREIGLPIPEPIIAIYEEEQLFASIDADHPNLSHSLTWHNDKLIDDPQNTVILKKLADWTGINQAIGFDEWIANGDRHTGNILWDGKEKFVLIDHNLAMRLPFAPHQPIDNQLLNIKLFFTYNDEVGKQRIKNHINELVSQINNDLPASIAENLLANYEELNKDTLMNIVDFLSQRLMYLTNIVHQKIPLRQQSL
ncbi:HipA family kinase [Methylovulum psychrotolerans]|uniref:HipA-like kinase domain-containing protein n=1 Tax=Methylovulum psychrotolerans TaxID=1704499 RepID=A0A2S5CFP7_9GAMM|nr:HipA family kinase [Methylovulum psychrotolerans]POZ49628.1 hypothetical protein AADEFJLK_04597 [Methylovulum psychrotolerans]